MSFDRTIGVALWLTAVGSGVAGEAESRAESVGPGLAVRVGVSAACFSHVAPGGLRLGARLLARHLSVEVGQRAELQVCETKESLVRVMSERDLDVVMMPAEVFVELKGSGEPLEAWVMSGAAVGVGTSWVLLTPEAGGDGRWAGGTVLVADAGRPGLASLWLRGIDRRAAGAGDTVPLREVIELRPTLAVLRVFLGKADGCVVQESEFAQACADNPQLDGRLRRAASSAPLPGVVVCTRTTQAGARDNRLEAAVARLPASPHGRALAGLLRAGQFVPFDPVVVPAIERLLERTIQSPGRPAGVSRAPASRPRVPSR